MGAWFSTSKKKKPANKSQEDEEAKPGEGLQQQTEATEQGKTVNESSSKGVDQAINMGPLVWDNAEEIAGSASSPTSAKPNNVRKLSKAILGFNSRGGGLAPPAAISNTRESVDLEPISYDWQDYEFEGKNGDIISLASVPKDMPIAIYNSNNLEFHCFSPVSQVTIETVQNSYCYIGPCESSVFLRDCKNCVLLVTCSQLRLKECQNVKVFSWCLSMHSLTRLL